MFNSQAGQDRFILSVLNNKINGYFLEIGSNHPIIINNTYILENNYGWNGIMIEYDNNFLQSYKNIRPNSIHIINDATKVEYFKLFTENNTPKNIDYLQIDLEVVNGSTINTLKLLNEQVFKEYKFAVITFEHDIYRGNFHNTRDESRKIFKDNGYYMVYGDVQSNSMPFEDWYVHPELVNMEYIDKIKSNNSLEWKDIIQKFDNSVIETRIRTNIIN
jgi:hypothetical protein